MTMTAKYPGRCKGCGGSIVRGEEIEWSRGKGARHVDCGSSRLRAPSRRVHTVQFGGSDDTVYTRNVNGRCEDAPCCGCCTI